MSLFSDLLAQWNTPDLTKAQSSSDAWAFNGGAKQWGYYSDQGYVPESAPVVDTPAPTPVAPIDNIKTPADAAAVVQGSVATDNQDNSNPNPPIQEDTGSSYPNYTKDRNTSFFWGLFDTPKEWSRSNLDAVWAWISEVGWLLSSAWNFIWNKFDNIVLNKDENRWINDLNKYDTYMKELNWFRDKWDKKWVASVYEKLISESVINKDQYNKSLIQQQKDAEAWKWLSDFKQSVNTDYLWWVKDILKTNNDPYTQALIQAGSDKLANQLWWMYSIIEDSYTNDSFNKEDWKAKLDVIKNEQQQLFTQFSKEIVKNPDDWAAYDATVGQERFRKYAEHAANFYNNLRDASVSSAINHYDKVVSDWHIVDKLWGGFMWLSNIIQYWLNQVWTWIEKVKEKTIWNYDISEDLSNLNIQKKKASPLASWLWYLKWWAMEIINWAPQFLPETVWMIVWDKWLSKIWKISKISKMLEWLKSTTLWAKLTVWWTEFMKNMLVYDVIWRWMLDRGTTWNDVAMDVLISWSLSWMIWVLASPISKDNKLYRDTLAKYWTQDAIVNDEVIKLMSEWDEAWALALSNKLTLEWSTNAEHNLVNFNEADRNRVIDVFKTYHNALRKWENKSLKLLNLWKDENIWFKNELKEKVGYTTWAKNANSWDSTKQLAEQSSHDQKTAEFVIDQSIKLNPNITSKQTILYVNEWLNKWLSKTIISDIFWGINQQSAILNTIKWNSLVFKNLNVDENIFNSIANLAQALMWFNVDTKMALAIMNSSDANKRAVKYWVDSYLQVVWNKIVLANDLVPEWAIYWKWIKVNWEFKDIITWDSLDNQLILTNKNLNSVISNFHYNITDIKEAASKLEVWETLDIKKLFLSNEFISWVSNPDTANAIIKSIINDLWIKTDWLDLLSDEVFKITGIYDRFLNKWVDVNNMTPVEMWVIKLIFFEDLYKWFEEANIVLWEVNEFKYITPAFFKSNKVFNIWSKWSDSYKINIKNWDKIAIKNFIRNIIASSVANKVKIKWLSTLYNSDIIISNLKKGKTPKIILRDTIDENKVLNKNENKALKNKIKESTDDVEEIFKFLNDEDKIAWLNHIQESHAFTNATANDLSKLDKDIQKPIIEDILNKVVEDSPVLKRVTDEKATAILTEDEMFSGNMAREKWVCPTF